MIRTFSYFIASLAVAVGFAIFFFTQAYSYKMKLEYSYQRALSNLTTHVNSIDLALQKGIYAGTSAQLVGLSSQIWRESGAAKSELSQIPFQSARLTNTYKFISQVGDYANSLSRKITYNQKITESDRKNLNSLYTYANKLSQELSDLNSDILAGRITIFETTRNIKQASNVKAKQPAVENGFQDIENNFSGLPSLIYDGPFSDNILKKTAELTKGKKQVARAEAKTIAASFLALPVQSLSDDGESGGNLPTYNFKTPTISIDVSKTGGYVVRMVNSRTIGDNKQNNAQAVKSARTFLNNRKIGSMKESYFQTDNNVCTINFAYMQGDVICYPDLIKVGVALDNGQVVSFDATGYIMNHKTRKFPTPKITAQDAQKHVNPLLKVTKASVALIPREDTSESLCYEIHCKNNKGNTVLDYYNVETGNEDQILILLETPGGTLAI